MTDQLTIMLRTDVFNGMTMGTKYGSEVYMTEEVLSGENDELIYSMCSQRLVEVLSEAYGRDFIATDSPVNHEKVWSMVKNINTDDELEKIRRELKIDRNNGI